MAMKEGASITRPPLLDGSNYPSWKSRMKFVIQAQGTRAWHSVVHGWTHPMMVDDKGETIQKDPSEWTRQEEESALANSQAIHAIFSAVDEGRFSMISACETAKEVWDMLQTIHEGSKSVISSKLQILTVRFEELKMDENETIGDFHERLRDIANQAHQLGKKYSNVKLVKKTLRSLPPRFIPKIAAIEEAHDIDNLSLEKVIDILTTFEMNLLRGKQERSKGLTLQVEARKKEERKARRIQCRECQGFGHIQSECANTLKKQRGKSFTTTWSENDFESDFSSEEDLKNNAALVALHSKSPVTCLTVTEKEVTENRTGRKLENFRINSARNSISDYDSDRSSYDDKVGNTYENYKALYEKLMKMQKKNESLKEENLRLKNTMQELEKNLALTLDELGDARMKLISTEKGLRMLNGGTEKLDKLLEIGKVKGDLQGKGYKGECSKVNEEKLEMSRSAQEVEAPKRSYRFIPTCHFCGVIGHIRSRCYQLLQMIFQRGQNRKCKRSPLSFQQHPMASKQAWIRKGQVQTQKRSEGKTRNCTDSQLVTVCKVTGQTEDKSVTSEEETDDRDNVIRNKPRFEILRRAQGQRALHF